MIEDNWTAIKQVLETKEWVGSGEIEDITGIRIECVLDLLKTATKRDVLERRFIHFNTSNYYSGGTKRYHFVWRLKR